MKNKNRVAFFSRVSTDLQHSSIENQQKIFEQWLDKNQNCTFYKLYEDEGISGSKAYKRVQWLKMLEDGKNGLYDVIVCKSFSRFGRNIVETLSSIKELRARGIRCVFLEDNLDSEKDMGKFGLFAWLAEEEANKTSERIKQVWDSFNQEGKVHVTRPPYGYEYDDKIKNFVVNNSEMITIQKIFDLYLKGYGFNKIAQLLIDKNIPTKRGGRWAGETIRIILTNEFYVGTLVQGKTRTIDATMKENTKIDRSEWYRHQESHEPIIDKEIFYKVNKIINERSRKIKNSYTVACEKRNITFTNSKERNSNKSLFSNLLKCGECGSTMTIKRKKKDNYKPYYQCISYDRISLKCGHKSNRVNEDILVNIIEDELRNLSENNFKKLKEMSIIKKLDKHHEDIEKEILSIDNKIKKQVEIANLLFEKYSSGVVTDLQFGLQNDDIQKALNDLVGRKKSLGEQLHQNTTKMQEKEIYKGIEGILNKPVERWSNAELKQVIDSIVIYIDGTIKVNIKYFN